MSIDKSFYKEYKEAIDEALRALGKDNFFLIMPAFSFPAPLEMDTGICPLYSDSSKQFILFLQAHGINGIQLTPTGMTSINDPSPYTASLFSSNFLLIDLVILTKSSWAFILKEETLRDIVNNNPALNKDRIAYKYLYKRQLEALKEAYKNFNTKVSKALAKRASTPLLSLNKELDDFIISSKGYLYSDAIFYALSLKYKSDDWANDWDYIDRSLGFVINARKLSKGTKSYLDKRIIQIEKDCANEISFYYFVQFILHKQRLDFNAFAKEHNFKIIADSQISLSNMDLWSNQGIFLLDYCLGVPPDYFSSTGQAWGFPIFDPDKLFKNAKKEELGEGGLFLKRKFDKIFSENTGVRIDHFIGLIDPWVYRKNDYNDARIEAGRLFSSPDIEGLKRYSYIKLSNLDKNLIDDVASGDRLSKLSKEQLDRYSAIVSNIVLSSAKESGSADFILICEDLGTITYPVKKVMQRYGIGGIRLTEFVDTNDKEHIYRGINACANDLVVAGTHDNDTLINFFSSMPKEEKEGHIALLIEDLLYYKTEEEKDELLSTISIPYLVELKVAELFLSPAKNAELMFSDLFRIKDRYNMPATQSKDNWTLRLSSFYSLLSSSFFSKRKHKDTILNMPHILSLALKAKGKGFVKRNENLLKRLYKLSSVL